MNVIGSRPTGWWRDRPRAMHGLVAELEEFARRSGEPLTVVFDGRPFEQPRDSGVNVRFASRAGPNAADDDIARLVGDDADPGSLLVVTSDADLARRARERGAAVLGAGEFRRRLDG